MVLKVAAGVVLGLFLFLAALQGLDWVDSASGAKYERERVACVSRGYTYTTGLDGRWRCY